MSEQSVLVAAIVLAILAFHVVLYRHRKREDEAVRAQLAAVTAECDRLASQLAALGQASDAGGAAIMADNADLRRRMDELAAELMRVGGAAPQ